MNEQTPRLHEQAHISARNVSLDYPIYGASSKDLRNKILSAATGGIIQVGQDNIMQVRAIENVSLEIPSGGRVGLYGHNGSGKTSLLRVLAGIVIPTAGEVEITGRVLPLLNIGVGTYPDLTGREVIRLRLRLDGYNKDQIKALEEEIVDFAELGEGFSNLPIRSYSSGMMTRLLFAIVTIQEPDILLADEWLSVADENFIAKAEQRLDQFVSRAGILVMASHNLDLLKRWCGQIYQLEHGHISPLQY